MNKRKFFLAFCVALFFLLRLPAIYMPYHQDEVKAVFSSTSFATAGTLTHPPLLQIWFVLGHGIFGPDNLRIWIFLFSIGSLIMVYLYVRRRAGERAALFSLFLFAISFYSVWASLMVDVDGSVLAFLSIFAFYSYERWRKNPLIFGLVLFIGLLFKLSFILVIGAIVADYLFENRRSLSIRRISILSFSFFSFASAYVAALFAFEFVNPYFSIHSMLGHAEYYTGGGRNYLQIIVEAIKALYYLSPLLLAPLILFSKKTWSKARPLIFYLLLGLIFYLLIFDFSKGALDKYLMFYIIPLSIISGIIFSDELKEESPRTLKKSLISGFLLSVVLFLLNFLPQIAVPLYPKGEWFGRVLHFYWNVLTPFTGGSGPVGFYVSFLFIALCFILAIILSIIGRFNRAWRSPFIVALIFIGIIYNIVFAEELSFGKINGSASSVIDSVQSVIKSDPKIKSVITYNDIDAYRLQNIGKYAGRFYATPSFEETHKALFAGFDKKSGYYSVIEIPLLYNGFYKDFFSKCSIIFETKSGAIPGYIYKCK